MILKEMQESLRDEITVIPAEVTGKWFPVVMTPFQFADGDHFVIIYKKIGGIPVFSDGGFTLAHLEVSYDSLPESLFSNLKYSKKTGELYVEIESSHAGMDYYAEAFYAFVQALIELAFAVFQNPYEIRKGGKG